MLLKRLLLVLLAVALTLLLAEGVLSLFFGRSLRPRQPFTDEARLVQTDDERRAAAASLPGIYRVHEDPMVGYVLRYQDTFDLLEARVTPDRLGLRARPGPPPPGNARRIVVLGDSVAFGVGLNDEETIAAQLEEVLAGVQGPGADPVACRTVAIPGWNHRNAVHFLFDHFETLDPEIVVYLPIPNDLTDTYGVYESGHRRITPDIATKDPWLPVNVESLFLFKHRLAREVAEGGMAAKFASVDPGPNALGIDLTPESRQRYDANADSIAFLAGYLHGKGRKLLLLHYSEATAPREYTWVLRERLLDQGLSIPGASLFVKTVPALVNKEKNDPHPNPRGARAIALWTARELLERGWISAGPGLSLPEVPGEAEALRAPEYSEAEIREKVKELKARALSRMQPEINLETGNGFNQIFGGLNLDGTLSARFLAVLKGEGPFLHVKLTASEASQLFPLQVTVEAEGTLLGRIRVPPAGETGEGWFELPRGRDPEKPLEIRLSPEHWVVHGYKGKSFVASCRIVSLRIASRD